MRVSQLLLSAGISFIMIVLPAASARAASACVAAKPTPASNTWAFQKEADDIFEAIQSDATQARYHAEELSSFALDEELSPESHAIELMQLRSAINDVGERLCRLETIRRVVAPWQQRTIDRIATTTRLLADNAQDAIVFENSNPRILWSPVYRKYVNNLYSEARNLDESVTNAVQFAKVNTEYQELRKDLGAKTSS